MPAIAAISKVSMRSCHCGYRAVSKIQRVPVEGRSVRKTGRAPTGGELVLVTIMQADHCLKCSCLPYIPE
jgi:hypothetical protein